jgi:hypothetical protein
MPGPVSFFASLFLVIVGILLTFRYVDGDHLPEYSKMSPTEEDKYDLLAICHNYALVVEAKQDPLIRSCDVVEAITTGKDTPVMVEVDGEDSNG